MAASSQPLEKLLVECNGNSKIYAAFGPNPDDPTKMEIFYFPEFEDFLDAIEIWKKKKQISAVKKFLFRIELMT